MNLILIGFITIYNKMKRNYNFVKLNKRLSSNRLFLALLFFTVFTCFSYAQTCTTESWSGSTVIPDGFSLASETVNFSTSDPITDVNVTLNITHGYVGDLYIRLTSPIWNICFSFYL